MEQILLEAMPRHIDRREVIRDSQHGFTTCKAYFTDVMAFTNDGLTLRWWLGEEQQRSLIDFCKAFDMSSNNSLVSKLARYRFDRWIIRCIRDCLDGHIQRTVVNGSMELINKWCSSRVHIKCNTIQYFINVMDSEVECNLSKCAGDTKLSVGSL